MLSETVIDLGPRPQPETDDRAVIALIPAAGHGRRLGRIPCSKELLPLGWSGTLPTEGSGVPTGTAMAEHLLDRLVRGGIRRALVLLREGKWDIPARFRDGHDWGLDLAYLVLQPTASAVETLEAATPWVEEATIALGFPDIVFRPADAFLHLLRSLRARGADVALGLFPNRQPERSDMVEIDEDGTVRRILVKRPDQGLPYAWSIAVWTPVFTRYVSRFLAERRHAPLPRELYVGDVVQAAIDEGLQVAAHVFERGASADLGTPEALASPPAWVQDEY